MKVVSLILWPVAAVFVASALYQLWAVVDIVGNAIWQWYKFAGYGGGGHITLSWGAAMWFYGLSGLLLIGC